MESGGVRKDVVNWKGEALYLFVEFFIFLFFYLEVIFWDFLFLFLFVLFPCVDHLRSTLKSNTRFELLSISNVD